MTRARISIGLTALLALACGESTPEPEARTAWTGLLAGTDAVVGLVKNGDAAMFYACGGPNSFATLTKWFAGTISYQDGDGRLALSRDGWNVTATLAAGTFSGTLDRGDGAPLTFTVDAVKEGTLADLYRGDQSCPTGAVILQANPADPPRLQGVWCDGAGRFEQVEPVAPTIALTGEGKLEVKVGLGNTSERFLLGRALP